VSIPGAGIPGDGQRRSAWRKALVYFGFADDDPNDPYFPEVDAPRPEADSLARIERKLDAQAEAIAALRADVERLQRRGP